MERGTGSKALKSLRQEALNIMAHSSQATLAAAAMAFAQTLRPGKVYEGFTFCSRDIGTHAKN